MSDRQPSTRNERGAILVLVALLMTTLIIFAAIVIDLGSTRSDRRNAQAAVDNAATSGALELGESGAVGGCESALAYLGIALEVTFDDSSCATTFSGACNPATPRATPPITSGHFTITVEYPVRPGLLQRAGTIQSQTVDASTADGTACQQLGIGLTTNADGFFGGIVGATNRRSTVHAVARALPQDNPFDVPAFLILERRDCGALVDQNTSDGITVGASVDGTEPGLIHVDSLADPANGGACGGVDQDFAVYGTPLPSGVPSISVLPSTVAPVQQGKITVAATNGRDGATYPGGLNVDPEDEAEVVSRLPVDNKYRSGIEAMHLEAWPWVRMASPPVGYVATPATGSPAVRCTIPPLQARIWVTNCPSLSGTFSGVTEMVFAGPLSLGSTTLELPNAERLVIKGQFSMGNSGALIGPKLKRFYVGDGMNLTGNGSRLIVNSTTETGCGSAPLVPTEFVLFGGDPSLVLHKAALCWTTVYLAGPQVRPNGDLNSTYARQLTDSTSHHPTCSLTRPCPLTTTGSSGNQALGALFFLGGGNTVHWSAPDQYDEIPDGTPQGLEDLAFVSEGTGTSDMANSSVLRLSGVLFGPNMTVNVRSPVAAIPEDAQFIARKLKLFQGGLYMRPTPADSVQIPSLGGVRLIR